MFTRAITATRLLLACGLLAATCAAPASAQTVTGTMQGTVTDTSGAVMPGVTIVVRNIDTGQTRELVTNDVGFYVATFLPVGRYSVTAALSGFGSVVREDIQVQLNQTRIADFKLDPTVTETVTVTGAAPPINSTNAEVKGRLSAEQIMDKPTLNPGTFLDLASIFPGFQENPTSGQNNPTASSGSSINFNGTGTRGATFQINGVNNDDSSENQNRQGASISTIKEFQVITNTYSAEFGRGYGAVVLVQTKSGTNQLHGDAYWYLQDSDDLTAMRMFATTKPVNQRNQYGGTAGFPIVRDKLFGFASFDQVNYKGTLGYARDFPLPALLSLPRLTRGNDTPENRAWIESILARYPSEMVNNDPRSAGATLIGTYSTNFEIDYPQGDYSGRLDWQIGQDSIVGRYQYTKQKYQNGEIIEGEQTLQDNKQQNLGITWTKIFRNNVVGEARYGLGLRSTNVDIAAGNDTPIVRFTGSPVSGTIIGNAGNFPINRDQTDHQFVYNLSWLLGDHNFKGGTDIRFSKLDDFADNYSRGWWTFTTSCGGVTYPTPYHAFLDGCVNSFQKAWGPFFLENRLNEGNYYAEDNWRLTEDLTLNLGVRYEYVSAPTEKEDRVDYIFKNDSNNIEPRLGAAWAVPPSAGFMKWLTGETTGDASVRGGYGIYHGRLFQSVFSQGGASIRTNPPNAIYRTFSTTPNILNVSDPTLGYQFVPGPQTTRHTITVVDPDLEMPYTHQWSLSYERAIPFDSSLRFTYTGTRGKGTLRYVPVNLPVSPVNGPVTVVDHPNNAPAAGFPDLRGKQITAIAANVQCAGTGTLPGIGFTAACPNAVPIADNEISLRVPRTNERRPDPRYTTNLMVSGDAETWYDGLQIEWVKRFSRGLSFNASYTWSVTEDTTSEATFVGTGDSNQQGPDKKYARGYSRFHTPHRFTFNGSYVLPFWQDRQDLLGILLGGWQIAGVLKLASGTPFTVTQPSLDLNFDGFGESRPVILDRSILGNSVDDRVNYAEQLPRSAFRQSTIYDSVDDLVGRNTFFFDGLDNIDLGFYKNFRIQSSMALRVEIQVFNLMNTDQYGFPTSTDITNANFGRLNTPATTYIPRTVQVAARFTY